MGRKWIVSYADGLLLYGLLMNLWAFFGMALDKRRAVKGRWRIPERMLWLPALLGGSLGGLLGMGLCRHKIRKKRFCFGLPLLAAGQTILFGWLWWR